MHSFVLLKWMEDNTRLNTCNTITKCSRKCLVGPVVKPVSSALIRLERRSTRPVSSQAETHSFLTLSDQNQRALRFASSVCDLAGERPLVLLGENIHDELDDACSDIVAHLVGLQSETHTHTEEIYRIQMHTGRSTTWAKRWNIRLHQALCAVTTMRFHEKNSLLKRTHPSLHFCTLLSSWASCFGS